MEGINTLQTRKKKNRKYRQMGTKPICQEGKRGFSVLQTAIIKAGRRTETSQNAVAAKVRY